MDINDLKKLHNSANIMFHEPDSFIKLDIPSDLKESWIKYIHYKNKHSKMLKKYGFEIIK